ncbi:MAG: helix-turn-helix transcriptional regulator [Clostridia bacterium]|nr:helix-turn-helix transcriptional regulator [Clostridia bacterium]
MKLSEAIKLRLNVLMKKKGFSQYDFYVKGGIAKSTVSQVLNGTRERVAIRTIYEMISTMEVSLKEFFDDPIFDNISD